GNLFISFCMGEVSAYIQVLMARKQCFENIPIYTEYQNISDRKLIAQLAYHHQGILLYEPLFFRRLHESNFSSNNILNFRDELISELTEYKKKKMLPRRLTNQRLFKACLEFSEDAIKNKKWLFSFDSALKAWYYKPF